MLVFVLAHLAAPLHSFLPRGTLKGRVLFPCNFLRSEQIHGEIHCRDCFKALESTTEDAVIVATLAD